ncbi:MAG: YlmC/YmxH family sporulation protein [Bacillota bacterium]|nr:YlmC/YmxH family sporulation protein [Bacillota bacterium]
MSMNSLKNVKMMEVIDIKSGCKLGYIKDLKIDCHDYKIISIVLPSQRSSIFNRNEDIEIPWERITKIGVDVILVDGGEVYRNNDGRN